jgi:transposase
MSADLFWFSDEQWAKIQPHLPTNQRGPQRHDDRRILSGIMHVQKVRNLQSFRALERARHLAEHIRGRGGIPRQ